MITIHQLAAQIAPYLHGWEAVGRYEHSANLVGPGGREMMLRIERGRLHISGDYPAHGSDSVISSYDDPPTITVSLTRKPAYIATDILRRFLPRYEETFKLAQERVAQAEAQERAIKDHITRLSAIIGAPYQESEVYINQHNPQNDTNLYGRFVVSSENDITLSLRGLSLAQALAVAKALNGRQQLPGRQYAVYYHRKPAFVDSGLQGTTQLVTSDLPHTHSFITHIRAHSLDDVCHQMQAENWSPNGEARPVIEAAGVSHTSLSIGDVVRDPNGKFWECVSAGWRKVEVDQPLGQCWQCDKLRDQISENRCPHCAADYLPF